MEKYRVHEQISPWRLALNYNKLEKHHNTSTIYPFPSAICILMLYFKLLQPEKNVLYSNSKNSSVYGGL